MSGYTLSFSCVQVPTKDCTLDELLRLCDKGRDISLATFKRAIGAEQFNSLATALGYVKNSKNGLTLAQDYHVRFKSVWHRGKYAYFMVHSAIEYVFTKK